METAKALQPHQQRVVDEKAELDVKIDKLKAFIMESPIFQKLPDDERTRLNHQYDVMALRLWRVSSSSLRFGK